jgi:hypothetical protein
MGFVTITPLVGTRADGAAEMKEDDQAEHADREDDPEDDDPPSRAAPGAGVRRGAGVVGPIG